MPIFVLSEKPVFPPPYLSEDTGLLAVGGDLSIDRLLAGYRNGIFPWYCEDEPILWWSPNPRLVLYPKEFKIHKRLARTVRGGRFKITMDTVFSDVIRGCAVSRISKTPGTWIVPEMIEAYIQLYAAGYAHSVEAWQDEVLVGGLYGVSLGRCFFGESMFTRVPDASKIALTSLVQHLLTLQFEMIDCQVVTSHLVGFGAREIPRRQFLLELKAALQHPSVVGRWCF